MDLKGCGGVGDVVGDENSAQGVVLGESDGVNVEWVAWECSICALWRIFCGSVDLATELFRGNIRLTRGKSCWTRNVGCDEEDGCDEGGYRPFVGEMHVCILHLGKASSRALKCIIWKETLGPRSMRERYAGRD